MKLKTTVLLLILSLSFSSQAIRHVGSGGGDAELKLQEMNPLLPAWSKACMQNTQACWNGGVLPSDVMQSFAELWIDFSEEGANYNGKVLVLKNSDLYEKDLKTPLSDERLASHMLKSLFSFQGFELPQEIELYMLPVGQVSKSKDLYLFQGAETDILFSPKLAHSVHQELLAKISCQSYRWTENTPDGMAIRCVDDLRKYQIYLISDSGEPVLRILYDGESDI